MRMLFPVCQFEYDHFCEVGRLIDGSECENKPVQRLVVFDGRTRQTSTNMPAAPPFKKRKTRGLWFDYGRLAVAYY